VFRTSDLKLQRQFQLSQDEIDDLTLSRDGKYLYASDVQAGKLAVVEAASGREVKIITSHLVPYPAVVIPLP
jgi:6-phosphogluconolactonase (cycloisomerase 2 family)